MKPGQSILLLWITYSINFASAHIWGGGQLHLLKHVSNYFLLFSVFSTFYYCRWTWNLFENRDTSIASKTQKRHW